MRTHRKNISRHSRKARTFVFFSDLEQFRRDHNLTKAQLAELLRISKSHLEILESPQSVFIPDTILGRLNALQRALAGQVRKMPRVQCPFHDCELRQVRRSGRLRTDMNMKRWRAECPICGEFGPLYMVRSDGEIKMEGGKLKVGGRPPKADQERRNFFIGSLVEKVRGEVFERLIEARRSLPKRIRSKSRSLKAALMAQKFFADAIEAGISAKTATIAA